MTKLRCQDGYDTQITLDCERVLVTLLRGLGPLKRCVFLIGGLTPRYLVKGRPPEVPARAGTTDIDVVVDMAILADAEAYATLENNLKGMKFERAEIETATRSDGGGRSGRGTAQRSFSSSSPATPRRREVASRN